MQTLGRRESPQRALQDRKENASLESVVENSCDRGLHATTAPHERTLFVKAQKQVRMRTDRLAAMTFSTGHSKKGHGINCAQRVTRGHVMGVHLHHLVFPGPWGMQSESST